MGGHFSVLVSELRDCRGKAKTAASGLKLLDPGGELTDATGSIPGAYSVTLMKNVGSLWGTQLTQLQQRITSYGENLGTAAADYERGDNVGAKAFNELTPETSR